MEAEEQERIKKELEDYRKEEAMFEYHMERRYEAMKWYLEEYGDSIKEEFIKENIKRFEEKKKLEFEYDENDFIEEYADEWNEFCDDAYRCDVE